MKIKEKHLSSALLFILLFTVAFNMKGQQAQIYGLKAGISTTTLTNQGNFNIKPGLQAGGYAKLGGGEAIFFKGEFLITQKGSWNLDNEGLGNFSLYYIDLPLMFGIDLVKNFTLNIGIQPSVLIGGTLRTTENGTNWRNVSNDLVRFDYSTLFGIEYQLKEKILIGARFNYSFVPIQNYKGDLTIQNDNELMSSRAFQVYLGFRLK